MYDGFFALSGEDIWKAAKYGDFELVRLLWQRDRFKKNIDIEKDGYTALYVAVMHNQLEIAKFLLKKGANPNVKVEGIPMLFVALEKGFDDVAICLLQNGADMNEFVCLEKEDTEDLTPLGKAVYCKRTTVVKYLLDNGVSPNQPKAGIFSSPLEMVIC